MDNPTGLTSFVWSVLATKQQMKTNLKESNSPLKALMLSTALFVGTFSLANANPAANESPDEMNYEINISVKELPTITLVDKNLRIVAEFYGTYDEVKKQFDQTFKHAELLSKHNNQSIYLVVM
jgi:hypothetical protein